ncbi:MAG: type IA DNA topoisomerase [Eubacterium sp.]|nr:type IA DNA topoisomerase [Eubacterium sp.]
MKSLFIAEKPSVAQQFADVLHVKGNKSQGYIEQGDNIITWCVGHLITMSYPEAYDPNMKKWALATIPFIPEKYKYEVIGAVKKQFDVVKKLLTREDVGTIYVCTDSGREGEYIYRLVDEMAKVPKTKDKRRVWIDSQTEEEILRGIKEAKPLAEYDNLSDAAYLRAKEDYLMGINFSRALTLKYSYGIKQYLGVDKCVIAVGRVMTCVLGMIVKREREIREFVPTPFYRVLADICKKPEEGAEDAALQKIFEAEWHVSKGSKYENSPLLYKENGFNKREDAEELIRFLSDPEPVEMKVKSVTKKAEKKNPPTLYNLAELQNDCSRLFKISPSETLAVVQELYEKKLVTYPRTDARVLSTAVAKEIDKNLKGLMNYNKENLNAYAANVVQQGAYKGLAKSKYVNDKLITDHYAIIPTGQGLNALGSLDSLKNSVYELIVRRFLSIFYPAAEYQKVALVLDRNGEEFTASTKQLVKPGYLIIADKNFGKKKAATEGGSNAEKKDDAAGQDDASGDNENAVMSQDVIDYISGLKKGTMLSCGGFEIKEGKTTAPKRYSSGSLILAMENAGQLIEDEELREQIKGSGIGTSATRDAIITKLVNNKYIALNKKTQILTPTFLGEIIYDVVLRSISGLLRADLTASWEKGLTGVAEGNISEKEYMDKMTDYVTRNTNFVKGLNNQYQMNAVFDQTKPFYTKK